MDWIQACTSIHTFQIMEAVLILLAYGSSIVASNHKKPGAEFTAAFIENFHSTPSLVCRVVDDSIEFRAIHAPSELLAELEPGTTRVFLEQELQAFRILRFE
jgi:hypothetical protein